jgi:hypothetical protein
MIGRQNRWVSLSKGGEYSNYYDDVHLLIDWDPTRETYRGFLGTEHRPLKKPASLDFFFRLGITFSRRTASRFSPRILPKECIFSDQGPGIFSNSEDDLLVLLGILNTRVFQAFLELYLGSADASSSGAAARHYEAGVIRNIPVPDFDTEVRTRIQRISLRLTDLAREAFDLDETTAYFVAPVQTQNCSSFDELAVGLHRKRCERIRDQLVASRELEHLVCKSYGVNKEGQRYIDEIFGPDPLGYPSLDSEQQRVQVASLLRKPIAEVIQDAVNEGKSGRYVTIKSYAADRQVEVVAHVLQTSALDVLEVEENLGPSIEAKESLAWSLLSYFLGVLFGRWDPRFLFGKQSWPPRGNQFKQLPNVPPGSLSGAPSGEDFSSVRMVFDVLVNDEGHPNDIRDAVQAIIQIVYGQNERNIEQEIIRNLGGDSLRNYLSSAFFERHISQYTKSRRKAPIYWELATPSASYAVLLYYHRFTKDTFYKVLNDYAMPKLQHEERKLTSLVLTAGANTTASQRKEIAEQEAFVEELRAFREESARVAPLWNPNLNDGVIINFAPLWRLVPQNRAWQKECKSCWDKLVAGNYDWAHLAMHLWPERVVPKCAEDRSLAIAHGLEEAFWIEGSNGKWQPRSVDPAAIDQLIKERTSAAVKDALKSLLEAPVPAVSRRSSVTGRQRKGRSSAPGRPSPARKGRRKVIEKEVADGE